MFSSWKEHKKGICSCCGSQTENSVRISDNNGFCSSAYTVYICKEHSKYFSINDQLFVKVDKWLFHEFNADYGITGCWESVKSEDHYMYIRNHKEDTFLSDIRY